MSNLELDLRQDMGMTPAITQEQTLSREVWDVYREQVGDKLIDTLVSRIKTSPDTAKAVVVVGEPSSGKGIFLSQGAHEFVMNPAMQEALGEAEKSLAMHYTSTAMMVKTGIARGWIDTQFGSAVSPEEGSFASQQVDAALQVAERELPREEPDAIHIFLDEFVAEEVLDLGRTTAMRFSGNEDAIVVFVPTHPQIQERAFRQRQALWEGRKNPKRMLRAFGTVFDLDPEAVRLTMGSPGSIQRIVERRNLAMYEAWRDEKLLLPEGPNKVPWDILRENDPRELAGDELKEFFVHLTEFSEKTMRTNPIRPYLQYGYYEYLAQKWRIAENAQILSPQFVSEVHGYPGFLASHALDVDRYIDRAAAERMPQESDIFVAQNSSL